MHNPEDRNCWIQKALFFIFIFFSMNFSSSLLLQLPRYQDFTVAGKTFEITPWPQPGWRPLDPGTGDEAHSHCLGQMWNMGCLDCEGWNDRRRFWSPMAGKKFKFNHNLKGSWAFSYPRAISSMARIWPSRRTTTSIWMDLVLCGCLKSLLIRLAIKCLDAAVELTE